MKEYLHFTVTGEFLTQHFRNLVLEEAWYKALQQLVESLHDFTYEQAVQVLSGTMKLEGENTVYLVPEDPQDVHEYMTQLHWLYSGIYCKGSRYYKPYAYIDAFGHEDSFKTQNQLGKPLPITDPLNRIRYYMDHPFDDLWYEVQDELFRIYLFQRCDPPPLWFSPNYTFQSSIDEYIQYCGVSYLDARGADMFIDDPPDEGNICEI